MKRKSVKLFLSLILFGILILSLVGIVSAVVDPLSTWKTNDYKNWPTDFSKLGSIDKQKFTDFLIYESDSSTFRNYIGKMDKDKVNPIIVYIIEKSKFLGETKNDYLTDFWNKLGDNNKNDMGNKILSNLDSKQRDELVLAILNSKLDEKSVKIDKIDLGKLNVNIDDKNNLVIDKGDNKKFSISPGNVKEISVDGERLKLVYNNKEGNAEKTVKVGKDVYGSIDDKLVFKDGKSERSVSLMGKGTLELTKSGENTVIKLRQTSANGKTYASELNEDQAYLKDGNSKLYSKLDKSGNFELTKEGIKASDAEMINTDSNNKPVYYARTKEGGSFSYNADKISKLDNVEIYRYGANGPLANPIDGINKNFDAFNVVGNQAFKAFSVGADGKRIDLPTISNVAQQQQTPNNPNDWISSNNPGQQGQGGYICPECGQIHGYEGGGYWYGGRYFPYQPGQPLRNMARFGGNVLGGVGSGVGRIGYWGLVGAGRIVGGVGRFVGRVFGRIFGRWMIIPLLQTVLIAIPSYYYVKRRR